jgi:site-specific DNA-methyltransferase (adenine-specific)
VTVTPYSTMDGVELYQADALAVLAALPSASVDAVVADPPYSSGGMVRGDRMQDVHTKYVDMDSVSGMALAAFTGDSRDQRSYAYWCALWLSECLRIARPGGVCMVFTDWRQLPATTDALQAGGWVWRGIVPWHKPNGRPVQGRFANNCEYVVWGTNGPRALNTLPNALPGFFTVTSPREREHITQKPVKLMQSLVGIAPAGGRILDPFMGSGTTGVAAVLTGREFVGVEMVPQHAKTAEQRIRAAQVGYRDDGAQLPIPVA